MFTVASFFAGVGGIDLGFEQTGSFETIYANEFDTYASKTFELNFKNVKVDTRDIHIVPEKDVPKTDVLSYILHLLISKITSGFKFIAFTNNEYKLT